MSSGTIAAVIIAVVLIAAIVVLVTLTARSRGLRRRFGPEYDRAVAGTGSRLKAESELADRERRVRKLDIRPLSAAALERYQAQWSALQERFVDSPADVVSGAQNLITSVMAEQGYPTDDLDQIMADLSVDHAATLNRFRTATDLSSRAADGSASTEDLRQAMIHFRALFTELLGTPEPASGEPGARPVPAGSGTSGTSADESAMTEPAMTGPAVTEPAMTGPGAGPVISAESDDLAPADPDPVSPVTSPAVAARTDPERPDEAGDLATPDASADEAEDGPDSAEPPAPRSVITGRASGRR